ncbi:glycosyltransferase family 2 protein [Vagococcus fluvialis]|uniref:glycosyltransferase family 2 protein n=1 Tax=Vagococcus fluvialis TaxID=2738 RepID=UPI003B5B3B20
MNEPLVSIIMPAYNAEKYIEEAIQSVQNQSYQNWELLICDDCSTDNTVKIIENKIKKDLRIKLFKLQNNCGAAIARNSSIKHAIGDYLAFLDSDDSWYKDKLRKQILFMEQNEYHFTCTYYNKIDENGENLNKIITYQNQSNYSNLLYNCPGNSTVIYNCNILGKFYISDLKKRNDYLMWLQVIKKSNKLICLDECLSTHRLVSTGLSNKKRELVKYHWYIYREIEKLSLFKSIKITLYWIFKGLFSKLYFWRR